MGTFLANIYSIGNLARNIYIADFVDVAIIALLIYSAIVLFKQTRSLPIFIGIGMLIALYAIAQVFNLYLTSLALQAFFGVFLIVLVVVFQQELRRFFEFIAAWSTRQRHKNTTGLASEPMQEILRACAQLANKQIGALMVFTGREHIDRHAEGGKPLDGIISEELLLSIFDPDSPGHDGAVIINKDRIVQFGAYLPLSHNFKEIGKRGTRHSAALGIAEQSDGLAIVVSEERGALSAAHKGKLTTLNGIDELERCMKEFLREHSPETTELLWERILKRNSAEKIIAIGLASVLWFFVSYPAETVSREFAVPIGYRDLPQTTLIENVSPKEFTVTLAGRGERIFELLDPQALKVTIDGKAISAGTNVLRITESMITRPLNFSATKISPSEARIVAKQFSLASVPVEATLVGTPARGFRVESVAVAPSTITLLVPEGSESPEKILTKPINITGLRDSLTQETQLVLPLSARLHQETDETITVTISIVPR